MLTQQRLGWQGMTIGVPADWSVTGFGGDARSGNLRADSANPDAKTVPTGIEIRWIDYKKPPTKEHLATRTTELLKAVEKTARRRKEHVETSQGVVSHGAREDRPVQLSFRWKSGNAASGRIWYCKTCGRVVIVQVYGHSTTRFPDQAGQIIGSIGCHGDEIGWRHWALYGLDSAAPATYSLASQQVMNIYLQLVFRRENSDETLTIEQWSLANVQLKNAYLDEWFESKAGSSLAHVRYEKREAEVHGHAALTLTGRRRGLLYWLSDGLRNLMRFRLPANNYDALLWECADSNKTYLIQSFSRKPAADTIREIADRTVCHAE